MKEKKIVRDSVTDPVFLQRFQDTKLAPLKSRDGKLIISGVDQKLLDKFNGVEGIECVTSEYSVVEGDKEALQRLETKLGVTRNHDAGDEQVVSNDLEYEECTNVEDSSFSDQGRINQEAIPKYNYGQRRNGFLHSDKKYLKVEQVINSLYYAEQQLPIMITERIPGAVYGEDPGRGSPNVYDPFRGKTVTNVPLFYPSPIKIHPIHVHKTRRVESDQKKRFC